MLSGLMESLLALYSSIGNAAIWKSLADVVRTMIAALGFLAFMVVGTMATLFMPPRSKLK